MTEQHDLASTILKLSPKDGDIIFVDADYFDCSALRRMEWAGTAKVLIVPVACNGRPVPDIIHSMPWDQAVTILKSLESINGR